MRATLGEYVPNALGYTRAAMLHSNGCDSERRSQSHKLQPSSDRGLQLILVTLEFVVIGFYQSPVNKSMPLALTARQTNRVLHWRNPLGENLCKTR